MRDDYLWDGSGESDPEIEKLEGLLGRYRSERPAPELPETPVVPFRPRRSAMLVPYAAAAAIALLSLALGLWLLTRQEMAPSAPPQANVPPVVPTAPPVEQPQPKQQDPLPVPSPEKNERPRIIAANDRAPRPKAVKNDPVEVVPTPAAPAKKIQPLMDLATADHIEQAEMMLRSFRNTSADDADAVAEVAFDSRQSKELLDRNILLRRSAETRKNLPMGQLLGDLEPFLIDIANLGADPSSDDVEAIQQRIQRREIVSDLELYSSNRSVQGL